jgi:hypothetical protein
VRRRPQIRQGELRYDVFDWIGFRSTVRISAVSVIPLASYHLPPYQLDREGLLLAVGQLAVAPEFSGIASAVSSCKSSRKATSLTCWGMSQAYHRQSVVNFMFPPLST